MPVTKPVTSTRTRAVLIASTLLLGAAPAAVAFAPAAGAVTPTKLTLRTDHVTYIASKPIRLSAHLNVANATVTFYEKVPGSASHVIHTGTTDASGNEVIKGTARTNATYTVRFAGSSTLGASSASRTVKVKVKMITRLGGGFRTSGAYRVFHASKKGVFAVGVVPSKRGTRVSYGLQVRTGTAWKTLDRRKYTLDKDSVTAGTFRGVAGHKYRIRATWAGDKLNLGNTTAWRYASFVR